MFLQFVPDFCNIIAGFDIVAFVLQGFLKVANGVVGAFRPLSEGETQTVVGLGQRVVAVDCVFESMDGANQPPYFKVSEPELTVADRRSRGATPARISSVEMALSGSNWVSSNPRSSRESICVWSTRRSIVR